MSSSIQKSKTIKQETKISILVLAHNVEKYIPKALESILEQKVNFNYEILIGDDCSTDGTKKIIQKYQKKYPKKITLYLINLNRGNAFNFANLQRNAKGTYFTVLDGDDYWIDKNKLQKQIDFLDSNHDFTVCGHNSYFLYQEKNGEMERIYDQKKDKSNFTFICNNFENLLLGGKCPYMHTSSLIYRKGSGQDIDFEKWKNGYYRGDLIRTLFYGEKGKVKYLNEAMSVYRIHTNGIYTRLGSLEKEIRHIEFFLYHKKHTFKNKYNDEFNTVILKQYNELNNLSNGYYFTKVKYRFLKKLLQFKIEQGNKLYNNIMSGINFILFYIMSIFIKYKKWR